MKRIFVPVVILAAIILASCGSSTSHNINGQWFSSLVNQNQTPENQFRATFVQGSGSTITVSNFDFLSATPCFNTVEVTAALSAGSFQMTITTLFPGAQNNVLTLTGTRQGNGNFSGRWSATGLRGCAGSGTFTMQPQVPVDPPA
jgi:hypothetical protein